jgi:hypothetical protein
MSGQLKVNTSESLEGIYEEYINSFNALDVDQAFENFIRAYWIFPDKIRFDLADLKSHNLS